MRSPRPGRRRGRIAVKLAGLLRYYLSCCGAPLPWAETIRVTRAHWWPQFDIAPTNVRTVARAVTTRGPDAWLDRISSHLPRNPDPEIEAYLDVLEQVMLDCYLSAHEEEALIEVAVSLGLHRDQIAAVHATFLDAMAIAAWSDGGVTETKIAELGSVAGMSGLPGG